MRGWAQSVLDRVKPFRKRQPPGLIELLATNIAETLGPIEWLAIKLRWDLLSTRIVLLGKGRVHVGYRLGLEHGCKWCKRGGRI